MERFGNRPRSGGFNRSGSRDGFRPRSGGFNRGGGGFRRFDDRPREMHTIKCSECGKEDQVPFKPTEGKPVFCKECYAKKNPRFGERFERRPRETEKTEEVAETETSESESDNEFEAEETEDTESEEEAA